MKKPIDLGYNISLVDVYDLGISNRTGTYVFHEEDVTVIDTSASPSIPHLLAGLEALGVDAARIKYIIVTHIHLDHAGGAGLLLEKCPGAKVVVHPKGKRHLADPSRLIAGAKVVYGEKFEQLFDPIVPIPEERLLVMNDGDCLQIGRNRTLTFYDTPGHANHHFSIHDSKSNGIFTGDTIGVFYSELVEKGVELYLPSTSPNQFRPEAMLESANRLEKLNPKRIYFGHFGMSENPRNVFEQLKYWLPKFVEAGEKAVSEHPASPLPEKIKLLSCMLFDEVTTYLNQHNVTCDDSFLEILSLDLEVCAMGIIDFLEKK